MPRVLLIEDQDDQRNLYAECLTDAGFEAVPAGNALDGLKLFKEQKPDMVVLDIQMPGVDGIDALCRVLALDRNVPVIFYSAYPTFKGNFVTWAADAFVVKTGDPTELVHEVRRVLKQRGVVLPQESKQEVKPI